MTRFPFSRFVPGCLLLMLAMMLYSGAYSSRCSAAEIAAPAEKPNFVVFLIDDLDFDELNIYDYRNFPCHTAARDRGLHPGRQSDLAFDNPRVLMPNLDRLAKQGTVFDRFYVTSAVCTPARYGLFTGKYSTRAPDFVNKFPADGYGTLLWNVNLRKHEDNVAKHLKKLGYTTGFFGKWHNGTPEADNQAVKTKEGYDEAIRYLRSGFGFDVMDRVAIDNPMPHNLEWIGEGVLNFLRNTKDQPFFAYVAVSVPHHQYLASMIPDDPTAIPTPYGHVEQPPKGMPSRASIFERVKAAGVDRRMAPATWIDDLLGAVLQELDRLGLDDDTAVFFISDHQSRGKFTNYEAARVPAVARWPGRIAPGRRIDALCANIDLAPTLIEAAGGAVTSEMDFDGVSLLELLSGQRKSVRDALMLEIHHSRAIVTDRWKYIANRVPPEVEAAMQAEADKVKQEGGHRRIGWHGLANWHDFEPGVIFDVDRVFPHYFDADQVYDLRTDFLEQHNLDGDPACAAEVRRLKALLRRELQRLPHVFGEFTDGSAAQPTN